jgi:dienelactone hydrolase
MKKHGIIILIDFICTIAGMNADAQHKSAFNFSGNDLNKLPPASYSSLTQVYDDHALENRIVTFRDERLLTSRGIKTVYDDMPVYKNKEEWEKRKEFLRQQILVAAGLWPMPPKNPLKPRYYHKIEHDRYTVETVSIETYPGYFLVGDLYKPKGKGPFPAILTPHGHFDFGRFNNDSINSIPGRCINFALQGYAVFSYDMVGYNDTRQVSHTFADDSISRLYGINLLGLQLRNSILALDFLLSLPGVDATRIGITGASGGATQTFLLTAVDNRFQATAPVNMVSNNMQGGDLCEGAPGLRINTFNVEISAMVAPKPLLLISDTHDWTYNTRNTIVPMVKSIYHLYHAEDKLKNEHFDYVHNYNKASREAAYEFFGKWLSHDSDVNHFREKVFVADSAKYLLAFMNQLNPARTKSFKELPATEYHDVPNKLDDAGLKTLLKDIYAKQLTRYWPKDRQGLDTFNFLYGIAFRHLTGFTTPEATDCKILGSVKGKDFIATRFLIERKDKNDWIPCVLYQPLSDATSTVIVTADEGKNHWVEKDRATPNDIIQKLLNQKCNVLAPDLFKQGEHVLQAGTMTLRDEKDKVFAVYNLTDRQEQIQDLITIIHFIKETGNLSHNINLYSTGNTGITSLLLATVTKDVNKYVLDGNHFNPNTDQEMLTLEIPGIMRVGGLKTAMALIANKHLLLFNAGPNLLSLGAPEISKLENNNNNFSIVTASVGENKIIDFLNPVNALPVAAQKEKSQNWEILFDGKNTDKWRSKNSETFPSDGWIIKDGALFLNKKGAGDIITREKFSNFELDLDFNLTYGANSGVKYFVDELKNSKTGDVVINGPEYQIIDDYNHPEVKNHQHDRAATASCYLLYTPKNVHLHPAGQWNHIRIIAKGKHVEHWLNGVKVLSYERGSADFLKRKAETKFKDYDNYGELASGYILLTDHSDKVYFRNIKIKRL